MADRDWSIPDVIRSHPSLAEYKFFIVSADIVDFGSALVRDEFENDASVLAAPTSSNLPASRICLLINHSGVNVAIEMSPAHPHSALTAVRSHHLYGPSQTRGFYEPGGYLFAENGRENEIIVMNAAMIVSIINEPRVVERYPWGSRQQKKAAQKHVGMGVALDAWTRVSWDISKKTVSKLSRDPGFHPVPLHWRRGHYRRAAPHWKGATQRPDAIRPEDRDLWWQWIKDVWVGHPAFGVKKSAHAPRMSAQRIARRKADA